MRFSGRDDEGPGEHDAHLMDDDMEETVPCAGCGRQIWAYAQGCSHCGIHFTGEAWEFRPAGQKVRVASRKSRLFRITAVLLLVLVLLVWVFRGLPLSIF